MAYYPRGGAGRGRGGRGGARYGQPQMNQFEFELRRRCHTLMIHFPPNPQEAWSRMMFHKERGQGHLNNGQLGYALDDYTYALSAAQMFPNHDNFVEEHAKILCNRSLVLVKMRRFKDAEDDATSAIALMPTFVKGYWRAYQAVKGGKNGPSQSLPYLSKGLEESIEGNGTQQDMIAFLTELCTLLPNIYNNAHNDPVLELLEYPDIDEEKEVWTKVLQNLASNDKWNSIRMLITGNSGPECDLQQICSDFDFSGIDMSGIIQNLSLVDLKVWGLRMAVTMLAQGADVDKLAGRYRMPVVHAGVEISLRTDSVILLDSILNRYKHNETQKNAQNQQGQTGYHLVVLSSKAHQSIGENIVMTLLKYKCDCNIRDQNGRRPIDLVHMQGTNVYMHLKNAGKTVEELRADLEVIKSRGNAALKKGNNREALRLYGQALDIAKQSEALYKEAAVLYSNTANVYYTSNDLQNALTNAIAAVSCDKSYHKSHWWKGKILCQMGALRDGFTAYLDGYTYASVSSDLKMNFIVEAVIQLQNLNAKDLITCYNQLNFVDKDIWPTILQKMSTLGEWKCIAHLVFGPKFDQKLLKGTIKEKALDRLCVGVAGKCSKDSLDLKTIFRYLQRVGRMGDNAGLLDVLFVVISRHGNMTALEGFKVNERDRPLHAVTRFALLTGRTGLLTEVLKQPLASLNTQAIDGWGKSIFHTITQLMPLPDEETLVLVTETFLDKGFSPTMKDGRGKLAVDYLDRLYSGYVFDLFFQKVSAFSWDEVNNLREQGNQRYKSGDILESIELYTMAIEIIIEQPRAVLRDIPGKDIAVLYGNRAEGYLKLMEYGAALDDAKMCVSYHGHWYKAHLRVAKAMKGLKRMEDSYKAFINAYKDVDETLDDRVKIEILSEITHVCKQLPKAKYNLKAKLQDFPDGEGHIWAKTSYDLIKKGEWDRAAVAYNQFAVVKRKNPHFTFSLTPMCCLDKMKAHPWTVDLLRYFLDYGANKKTLTLMKGDTYIHAAVRICLLVVKNGSFLDWLLKKYKDAHLVDTDGNTPLHVATKVRPANGEVRYSVVIILLQANVNPNQKNNQGQMAIELLPANETNSAEVLRMAMYRAQRVDPLVTNQQETRRNSPKPTSILQPKQILKNTCEECLSSLDAGKNFLSENEVTAAYGMLNSIFTKNHKGKEHEIIVNQAMAAIVDKLGEKSTPEIPQNLTTISKEYYQRIVDGLVQNKKWLQLHNVVRKYRLVKGSDQLKRFASGVSIVPLITDPMFESSEDEQLQVINNMLNSGASIGSDNGQKALVNAKDMGHFKLVADLIRKGADMSNFSLKQGDTPIHAVVTLVLEKERALDVLEFVFSQYEKSPAKFPHLNPCQQNKDGDSLFHLVAKAKDNQTVRQVTEFLCKKNLSARYYNRERKLPISYITKKNDRRLQFIRLAATIEPVGQQNYGAYDGNSDDGESTDEEFQNYARNDETGNIEPPSKVVEKVKYESERDQMKRRIEELIRTIPEYKPGKLMSIPSGHARDPVDDLTCKTGSEKNLKPQEGKQMPREKDIGCESKIPKVDQNSRDRNVGHEGDEKQGNEPTALKHDSNHLSSEQVIDDKSKDMKEIKQSEELQHVPNIDEPNQAKSTLNNKECKPKEKNNNVEADRHSDDNVNKIVGGIEVAEESEDESDYQSALDELDQSGVSECREVLQDGNQNWDSEGGEVLCDENDDDNDQNADSGDREVILDKCDTINDQNKDNECREVTLNVNDQAYDQNGERKHQDVLLDKDDNNYDQNADTEPREVILDESNGDHDQNVDSERKEVILESDDEDDDDQEDNTAGGDNFEVEVFDNMEWEVECTADVWKTLRDKHVIPELKNRIVRKIQLLASGDWQPVLCKKLRNVPKTLDLFEAKFSKGSRIIWEKAIAFSPRCSESAERRLQSDMEGSEQPVRGGRIYSEIIRVWDIVFDHDKIYRSVDKIKKSHLRGEECIIQKKLKGIKADNTQLNLTHGNRIYPKMFAENDVPMEKILEQQEDMQQFFPPASSNETEYHILKFYSFSSTLVSLVLQNVDTKVDFPFRVTDLEHAIINLSSKAPILLLGRSGTGKTTCCLYRLWSQFLRYWHKAKEADSPLIPRCVEFVHTELTAGNQDEENDEAEEEHSEEEEQDSDLCGEESTNTDKNDEHKTQQYDHMHQIFITKNLVLCSEVQKNFRELSHAEDLMKDHVNREEEDIPNKLQEVDEYAFPLFLTSRQLLLMLDASIGEPYFFDRKEDGSLKADIAGWTDDGPLSVLSLLEEDSDDEDEEDGYQQLEEQEPDDLDMDGTTTTTKRKVDPRREITYQVFVDDVWPKIKKKLSYHPSLVWTEIMSFIKGSFEALSKPCGYLTKDDYLKLGKKRAPNFSAEREPIHHFFKRYEHFKKQHQLFDETDLVHNIYGRLKQLDERPWVIHQIYVDETQDFTQAELCLLIRICQNPNDMFLTGDTAQSIMRGISFRFSDLRSLFYHAKQSMHAMGKTSAVEVPKKVYQLVHNYRSHAGILSLASSVLELMVEFFPESFDRLQRDQGLFNGPQPILLESCSFSDLAVLLQGNKRKTSHIEFGAHQAILVVNETARETIPEELRLGLVLTIYEAKGLEFDDVLLYNFFKDSQATKEWRVVTDYLERLQTEKREQRKTSGSEGSLVEIDEDVLNEANRPRPLEFDPNLHKVLNSELKHLYTALTRARVNVWIFDEDLEKRAPMFEFFRAKKLVKSVTVSEINEESLAETVFAEKSSSEDWIRRGEDFTRHSLYSVAARCFSMAGDKEKENISLAHVQAVKASKLKDNPKEMRREFLKAAEMYLNCNRPGKAAICLQNARESELAAELFEKLGQYERAADVYKRLNRSIASSRCYEQLGNYNKAVEVLCDNDNFDMAIDTLKRYGMRIQEYRQKHQPIPAQLLTYRPADYFTEERLSYRAAEKFYKLKNKERMLESINSMTKVSDRVEFLEKRGFVTEAADILTKNGELKTAAELLLMNGFVEDATSLARRSNDDKTLGYCILISSRILMAKRKEVSDFPVVVPAFQQDEVVKFMEEGLELFESSKCSDEYGELCLLLEELSRNPVYLKQAWKAFKSSKPVQNDAGLVECGIRLLENPKLNTDEALTHSVQAVQHMFTICCALSKPSDIFNFTKVSKCLKLYGLFTHGQNELVIHLKERPICLSILNGIPSTSATSKRTTHILNKAETLDAIVAFLLQRSREWIVKIWQALYDKRERNKACGYFEAGLECPNHAKTEMSCKYSHQITTQNNLEKVMETDLLMISLEADIEDGAQKLRRICSSVIRAEADHFLTPNKEDTRGLYKPSDLREQFKACWILFDDLKPYSGHPLFIADNSEEFVKYLQRDAKPLTRIKDFLLEVWKAKTINAKKSIRCEIVKETEILMMMEFGYHLFGMKNRFKIDSPKQTMEKFERRIDREGELGNRSWCYLSLVPWEEGKKTYVEFIPKRFIDAYDYISSNPNPYEAVFRFSRFVILQKKYVEPEQLPDLQHYAMWLEFFLTVGIIVTAKLKAIDLSGFLFILPSSYIALLKFIEATFPNPKNTRVLTSIHEWHPSSRYYTKETSRLQDRLKYICFGVCGFDHRINILKEALRKSDNDPTYYSVVERIIILQMVLLVNMGKAMPMESETCLVKSLTTMKIPDDGPDRLKRLSDYIKHEVKGIAGIAKVLSSLLKCRMKGEELLLCRWDSKSRQKIASSILGDENIFSNSFLNEKTYMAIHGREYSDSIEEDHPMVDDQLTQEEKEKRILNKKQQDQQEKQNEAALKITNFFKRIVAMKRAWREISERKHNFAQVGFRKHFLTVQLTDRHCGFCGVYFDEEVSRVIEYNQSVLIGSQSVINVDNRGDGSQNKSFAGFAASSQEYSDITSYGHTMEQSVYFGEAAHGSQRLLGTMPPMSPEFKQKSHGYITKATGSPEYRQHGCGPISLQPPSPEFGQHGYVQAGFFGQRSVSYDEVMDYNKILYGIVTKHIQSQRHISSMMEFNIFTNKCQTKILPKLETIREFFDNSEYRLDDKEYAEKHYVNRLVEIERIQNGLPKLETEIMNLFEKRDWSNTGHIEQFLMELGTDFDVVRPYVEEISNKKDEQEKARKLTKASKLARRDGSDEEEDCGYEEVVEEPKYYERRRGQFRGRRREYRKR